MIQILKKLCRRIRWNLGLYPSKVTTMREIPKLEQKKLQVAYGKQMDKNEPFYGLRKEQAWKRDIWNNRFKIKE